MTNKLNEEQLEQVNGGAGSYDDYCEFKRTYTVNIDNDDANNYVGQHLFFLLNYSEQIGIHYYNRYAWAYGTLNRVWDKSVGCGHDKYANVTIEQSGGDRVYTGDEDISLERWALYTK